MVSYRLTAQEVADWDGECMGVVFPAPEHDIDTFYDGPIVTCWMGRPSVKREIIIPPAEKDLWNCPYCGAVNYTKVGHCHHCASPRKC